MRHVVVSAAVFAAILGLLSPLLPTAVTAQALAQSNLPRRYTHHPSATVSPKIIVMVVDGSFSADQRAKILRAIEEWNYALNGFIRFDLAAPGSGGLESWSIRPEKGGDPNGPASGEGQPLSETQSGFMSIGGHMLIYVDRIGTRDLRGVVLHELGHVLGLHHDPTGNLMSARYSPTTDQCIDKPTAVTIAARHNLPLAGLNWCETVVSP
jgi:matrixin